MLPLLRRLTKICFLMKVEDIALPTQHFVDALISSQGVKESQHTSHQFVRLTCDAVGITNMPIESIKSVASLVTFKIIKIICEAKKYSLKSNRSILLVQDIDSALHQSESTRLCLNNSVYGDRSLVKVNGANKIVNELYYYRENDVNVDEYLDQLKNLLKRSSIQDIGLRSHWLAINGVQPSIPENPLNPISNSSHAESSRSFDMTFRNSFIPLFLQVYYKEITEACIGTLEDKRKEALTALQRDPCIRSLMSPLTSFIYQGIRLNMAVKNLAMLIYLIRMAFSILQNPSISDDVLEHHLHEIVPSIISCIVSPDLCTRPFEENHWALRTYSSKLLVSMMNNFYSTIPSLQSNVLDILESSMKEIIESIQVDFETLCITQKNGVCFDISSFPYGSLFGVFYAFSQFTLELVYENLFPLLPQLSLLFAAVHNHLRSTGNDLLKREISRTEFTLLQTVVIVSKKYEIKDHHQLEQTVGKYFANIIIQQQTLKENIKS